MSEPAADAVNSSSTPTPVAADPMPGMAALRIRLTNTLFGPAAERLVDIQVPLSGSESESANGAAVQLQGIGNNAVLSTFKDAGVTVRVSVARFLDPDHLVVALTVEDSHPLQDSLAAVRSNGVPQLATQRARGFWKLQRDTEEVLYRFQRESAGQAGVWEVATRAQWNQKEARLDRVGVPGPWYTARSDVDYRNSTNSLHERFISTFLISGSAEPSFSHGRQLPVETSANGTVTTIYKDAADALAVGVGAQGDVALRFSSERVVFLPDARTSQRPSIQAARGAWALGRLPLDIAGPLMGFSDDGVAQLHLNVFKLETLNGSGPASGGDQTVAGSVRERSR